MSSVFEWWIKDEVVQRPRHHSVSKHLKTREYKTGHPDAVRLEQYTLDGQYVGTHPSAAAAARALNGNPSTIRAVIDSENRTAFGYRWVAAKGLR